MKRGWVIGLTGLVVVVGSVMLPIPAYALGLKVAPLQYKTQLKEGERQRGVVDVSNPSAQSVTVAISVQAFKQIDNEGGLQFYDDKQIAAGITTDLKNVELGPRQAVRMPFELDSGLLPAGDVYAAIFFKTEPTKPQNGVGQLVRVGTLLSIVNKSPGQRSAAITNLSLPLLQFGSVVKGSYRIKNTGPSNSGFYPTVEVSSWPPRPSKKIESSLVFGGRERQNDLTYDAGIGIHRVAVSYQQSTKTQWVVTIAPWMVLVVIVVSAVGAVELLLLKRRRKRIH